MKPRMEGMAMNSEQIGEEAARWFCKQDSGEWSAEDEAQFDLWLNSATAHQIAYIRVKAGWKGAARMQALGMGVPKGAIPGRGMWGDIRFPKGAAEDKQAAVVKSTLAPAAKQPARAPLVTAAAAALLVMIIGAYYIAAAGYLGKNRYSTSVGGLDTVPLGDGSRVILNTDTRIRVDLTDRERRIELDKGEAFFDVAKDAARPFVVQVNDKRVTAVGTKFSVRRDGDDIRVTVVEGAVRIDRPAAPSSPVLKAGSVAATLNAETVVREGSAPDAEQLLSWRSGYLVFEATPLADAAAEFNRYNVHKIVIEDPSIAALRIGGNFRATNTDAFLWLVQTGLPVAVERRDERIFLSKR